ncbi:MAG TPA: phosphoribosylanthranilate isomerase [Pirellulales bacterium]|nr:phosphoribosylanthranilate isomerase [Pirellulales bacterium]
MLGVPMSRLPFQIKICGVTTPQDAEAVVEAGADAIGLNFYSGSKRCVSLQQAWEIAHAIPSHVQKVGVFVNPLGEDVDDAMTAAALDMVQFHGKESPEFLAAFGKTHTIPMIKALRWEQDGRLMDNYLKHCVELGCKQSWVLIDSWDNDLFGGTGIPLKWDTIAMWQKHGDTLSRWQQLRPRVNPASAVSIILAGGLSPKNVATAIQTARPIAVDTASGVESAPGKKDPAKVKAFIDEAKRAFDEVAKP